MHDHNNNDNGMKSMMWMMIICCAVPLLLIVFLGAGGKALGAPTWVVLGGIAVMVIAHFFMMGKSHKHTDEEQKGIDDGMANKNKDDKTHSGHNCH